MASILAVVISNSLYAAESNTTKEVQDMSDSLAVYTQMGLGYTDRGFNIKIGKSYVSEKPATMVMNVIEIPYLDDLSCRC